MASTAQPAAVTHAAAATLPLGAVPQLPPGIGVTFNGSLVTSDYGYESCTFFGGSVMFGPFVSCSGVTSFFIPLIGSDGSGR